MRPILILAILLITAHSAGCAIYNKEIREAIELLDLERIEAGSSAPHTEFRGKIVGSIDSMDVWIIGRLRYVNIYPIAEPYWELDAIHIAVSVMNNGNYQVVAIRESSLPSLLRFKEWLKEQRSSRYVFPDMDAEFELTVVDNRLQVMSNCGIEETISIPRGNDR